MLKLVNLAGGLALLLLGRKLVWCLYWLWCWRHGRETPPPIGFDAHVQARDKEA